MGVENAKRAILAQVAEAAEGMTEDSSFLFFRSDVNEAGQAHNKMVGALSAPGLGGLLAELMREADQEAIHIAMDVLRQRKDVPPSAVRVDDEMLEAPLQVPMRDTIH
jgi:hypothetical protein